MWLFVAFATLCFALVWLMQDNSANEPQSDASVSCLIEVEYLKSNL